MSSVRPAAINEKDQAALNTADYWEQRLAAKPTLAGVGHNGFGLPYNEWMYKLRKRVFLRHVATLDIDFKNAHVLDIGSGTGFWLKVWQSLGVTSLTGSDLTSVATRNIRATFPSVRMLQLDITSASATETLGGQFDVISAIDMLYHILPDRAYATAILNISRSLKPGGYLVMTENLLHRSASSESVVQTNRTLDSVMQLLSENHLTVVRRAPVFVLMNYPVDTRYALAQKLWRLLTVPAALLNVLGSAYGAALFPVDLLLTKILKEGPSTEILICQKN